jgi:hypothetical protein
MQGMAHCGFLDCLLHNLQQHQDQPKRTEHKHTTAKILFCCRSFALSSPHRMTASW